MFITITSTQEASQDYTATEKFLSEFLPRLRRYPGVLSVYSYNIKDKGKGNTIVIWENEDAVKSYWNSELIKETAEFAVKSNVTITRGTFPLAIALG